MTFQRSVTRQVAEHLGQLDFLHARENVVLLGPPATGKTHLAIAVSIRACLAGQRAASRPPPSGSPGWPSTSATAASKPSCAGWA